MVRYIVLAIVISSVAAYPVVPELMDPDAVLVEDSATPAEDIVRNSNEYNQQKTNLATAFEAEVAGAQTAIAQAKDRNTRQVAAVQDNLKSSEQTVENNRQAWSAGNQTERENAIDAAQVAAAETKMEADIYASRQSQKAESDFQNQISSIQDGKDIDTARANRTAYQKRQSDNATAVHHQADVDLANNEAQIRSHYEAVENRIKSYAQDAIESLELNATEATTAYNNALEEEIHEINQRLSADQDAYQTAASNARKASVQAMNSDFQRLRNQISNDVDDVSRSSDNLINGDSVDDSVTAAFNNGSLTEN